MTAATLTPAATPEAFTILERSVCLTLACHYLGNDRKVDLRALVDAATAGDDDFKLEKPLAVDAEQFRATKKLIDPKALRPVLRPMANAKDYLRTVAVSAHRIFGERTYLVPIELVEDVETKLAGFAATIQAEAFILSEGYAAMVDRQRAALGPLFKQDDYKTADEIRHAFGITWDYVSFAAPDKLETVDTALFERTRARHEAKLSAAYDEVVAELRSSALGVVSGLVKRLTPTDGKKFTIHESALRAVQDYVALLPKRNIGDDDDLSNAVNRVGRLVAGLSVDDLRTSDALRSEILAEANEAKAVLAGLVEAAPRRAIAFGQIS